MASRTAKTANKYTRKSRASRPVSGESNISRSGSRSTAMAQGAATAPMRNTVLKGGKYGKI